MSFGIVAMVAGAVAAFATGTVALIAAGVSVVASVLYQQNMAAEAKKKAAAAADAAKGFQVTSSGEATELPIIYGRAVLGGVRVYAKTFSYYNNASTGGIVFQQGLGGSVSGAKNEYLVTQTALCAGNISNCWYVDVNDLSSQDSKYAHGQKIIVYKNGGTACPAATAMDGNRANARFSGAAFSTAIFKLNRDEPQYNGIPNLKFYVEGIAVKSILYSNGAYGLSSNTTFSTNPALCLLDYLLNTSYGKGISLDDIDLESFYVASKVCDEVVTTQKASLYKGASNLSIKLYEISAVLNTSNTIRDNISEILKSMGDAVLIWSAGKFRLKVTYPHIYSQTKVYKGFLVQEGTNIFQALVDNPSYVPINDNIAWKRIDIDIVDDNIIPNEAFGIAWPTIQDKLNNIKISYLNQSEGFKEDSVEWPGLGSSLYSTFLSEDSGVTLHRDESIGHVTDYYHALSFAEELVRNSRSLSTSKIAVTLDFWQLEPGDYIKLTSEVYAVPGELYKITGLEISEKGFIILTIMKFDARNLAWNAKDDEYIVSRNIYDLYLPQVTGLKFTPERLASTDSLGTLEWTRPDDIRVQSYNIYSTNVPITFVDSNTVWTYIGNTNSNIYSLTSIPSGSYTVAVASVDRNGTVSPSYNTATQNQWAMVSAGISAYYGSNTTMVSVSVYQSNNSTTTKPIGGSFNFETMTLTPPSGWTIVPSLSLMKLWQSDAIFRAETADVIWSDPYIVPYEGTYIEFEKPVVSVLKNDLGENYGYTDANSQLRIFISGLDVTSLCTIVIYSFKNVIANINNGLVSITNLIGDSGYVEVKITYNGDDHYRTLNVITFSPGYIFDYTPPPIPTGVVAVEGISFFVIEHDVPNFTVGHGYEETIIYGKSTNINSTEIFAFSTYTATDIIAKGNNTYFSISSDPSVRWLLYITWKTKDGVESTIPYPSATSPLIVKTGQDVSLLLEALNGEITKTQLHTDLINSIDTDINSATPKIFEQASAPTVRSDGSTLRTGDIWKDIEDNNKLYIYVNGSWSNFRDGLIEFYYTTLKSRLDDPLGTAGTDTLESVITTLNFAVTDSSGTVARNFNQLSSQVSNANAIFAQDTAPTIRGTYVNSSGVIVDDPLVAGDIWYDTDDSNKCYVFVSDTTWRINTDRTNTCIFRQTTSPQYRTQYCLLNGVQDNTYTTSSTCSIAGGTWIRDNIIINDLWYDTSTTDEVLYICTAVNDITGVPTWTLNNKYTDAKITTLETTKIGYCKIDGIPSDHTDKSSCETAGGVWTVGLPLASAVKDVQINNGSTTASIQQQMTTYASSLSNHSDSLSDLYGEYTIKVNLDGKISGFGLASTATASAFEIVADKFAIASSATSPTSGCPFYHLTTPTVINGITIPAGTYMNSAFIADATITNAKIGDAAITNAKIKDGAIDTAKIANVISSTGYNPGSTGWSIAKSGDVEFNNGTFRGTLNVKSSNGITRMEIKNNVIKIYENGIVRVQLGDLSA